MFVTRKKSCSPCLVGFLLTIILAFASANSNENYVAKDRNPSSTPVSTDQQSPSTTITITPVSERLVVCYYGSWATYRLGDGKFDVEDIDTSLCTHIIYGFAILSDSNEIECADTWNDIELKAYERFTNLAANNPNLKAMLAIGGWTDGSEKYSNMAADPQKRAIFVQSAVEFIKKYNFDGLDLNWEYPANRGGIPEDKENFGILIAELRKEFNKYGLLVTAAIGMGPDVLNTAYDFSAMCRDLDFINLMAYDLQGSWDGMTGHHTSLYSHPNLGAIANSLTNSLEVVNSLGGCPSKMVLGMGMYGKTYTLSDPSLTDIGSPTSGNGAPGPYTMTPGMLGYNEICELENYSVDIDNYTMAPWAYKGDQWFCYDDVPSIEIKSNWALENGLLGGMIWSIETDDFLGKCNTGKFPLLTQLYTTMNTPHTTTTTTTTITITTKITTAPTTSTSKTISITDQNSTTTKATTPPTTTSTTTTTKHYYSEFYNTEVNTDRETGPD